MNKSKRAIIAGIAGQEDFSEIFGDPSKSRENSDGYRKLCSRISSR